MASWAPVEAPEGTPARPSEPSSRTTSTSTVGLPRLSRISRPMISTIAVMIGFDGALLRSTRAACSECGGQGQARRLPADALAPFQVRLPDSPGHLRHRHDPRRACLGAGLALDVAVERSGFWAADQPVARPLPGQPGRPADLVLPVGGLTVFVMTAMAAVALS